MNNLEKKEQSQDSRESSSANKRKELKISGKKKFESQQSLIDPKKKSSRRLEIMKSDKNNVRSDNMSQGRSKEEDGKEEAKNMVYVHLEKFLEQGLQ